MRRRGRQSFWYLSPLCHLPSKCSGKEIFAFEGSAPLHLGHCRPFRRQSRIGECKSCARNEQCVWYWCIPGLSLEVVVSLRASCRWKRPALVQLSTVGDTVGDTVEHCRACRLSTVGLSGDTGTDLSGCRGQRDSLDRDGCCELSRPVGPVGDMSRDCRGHYRLCRGHRLGQLSRAV